MMLYSLPPRNPQIMYFISDRGWFYLGDTKYYSGTSETGLYLKLDANGKVILHIYDSVLGQMEYAGTFNPTCWLSYVHQCIFS